MRRIAAIIGIAAALLAADPAVAGPEDLTVPWPPRLPELSGVDLGKLLPASAGGDRYSALARTGGCGRRPDLRPALGTARPASDD